MVVRTLRRRTSVLPFHAGRVHSALTKHAQIAVLGCA